MKKWRTTKQRVLASFMAFAMLFMVFGAGNAAPVQAADTTTNAAAINHVDVKGPKVDIDVPDVEPDDSDPQIHKQIDYLGDGEKNPDTTVEANKDLYRLYLDLQGVVNSSTALDVLFVVDRTTSMKSGFDGGTVYQKDEDGEYIYDEDGHGILKDDEKLSKEIYVNQIMNDSEDGQLGILNQVATLNEANHIGLVLFGGPSHDAVRYSNNFDRYSNNYPVTKVDWQQDEVETVDYYSYEGIEGKPDTSGTNYSTALERAKEMFEAVSLESNNKKVLIFVTDGQPNQYFVDYEDGYVDTYRNNREYSGPVRVYHQGAEFDTYSHEQDSTVQTERNEAMLNQISTLAQEIRNAGVEIFTLNIAKDTNSSDAQKILTDIAGSEDNYKVATEEEELLKGLQSILHKMLPSVEVVDEISSYVKVYETSPELKITRQDTISNELVTIWEGFGKNGKAAEGYEDIIDYVSYRPSAEAPSNAEDSTGTVVVKFNPEYQLDENHIYTISYNVEVTDFAKKAGKYIHVGDEDTDYANNVTSSYMDGFYSNNSAYVSYEDENGVQIIEYPHPVVQIESEPGNLLVSKTISGNAASARKDFSFTITVTDEDGAPLVGTYGDITFDENGQYTFTLKGGESLAFSDLPVGTQYKVAESDNDDYRVTVNGTRGTVATGTIQSSEEATAAFNNYRSSNSGGGGAVIPTPTPDPEDPSDPSDPTDPEDPSDPSDPTDPEDPSTPSDPEDPENPSDPTDPVNPENPSEPTNPADPVNPVQPNTPQPVGVTDNAVQTSDNTNSSLWMVLLLASAFGLMGISASYRRRRTSDKA